MFVSAFVCWLRIDELLSIKAEHITFETDSDENGNEYHYARLLLPFRKTDQSGNGTIYHLFDDGSEPLLLLFSRLRDWYKMTSL